VGVVADIAAWASLQSSKQDNSTSSEHVIIHPSLANWLHTNCVIALLPHT